MKNLFFVGIHNKEDLKPLDIISKSGKIVSKIEKQLGMRGIRTNLADMDRMPVGNEIDEEAIKWWYRNGVESRDIVVLLGRFVQDNFHYIPGPIYIKLPHPASSLFHGTKTMEVYVNKAVEKIKIHFLNK
jgi:hypothetical protein